MEISGRKKTAIGGKIGRVIIAECAELIFQDIEKQIYDVEDAENWWIKNGIMKQITDSVIISSIIKKSKSF